MIVYDNRNHWFIFLQTTGSVVYTRMVMLPALLSTFLLAVLLCDGNLKKYSVMSPSVGRIYATLIAFVVVFRVGMGFDRYFEGVDCCQEMFSKWRDAFMQLCAFYESSKAVHEHSGEEKGRRAAVELADSKKRLLHWFSLLAAVAVETMKHLDDDEESILWEMSMHVRKEANNRLGPVSGLEHVAALMSDGPELDGYSGSISIVRGRQSLGMQGQGTMRSTRRSSQRGSLGGAAPGSAAGGESVHSGRWRGPEAKRRGAAIPLAPARTPPKFQRSNTASDLGTVDSADPVHFSRSLGQNVRKRPMAPEATVGNRMTQFVHATRLRTENLQNRLTKLVSSALVGGKQEMAQQSSAGAEAQGESKSQQMSAEHGAKTLVIYEISEEERAQLRLTHDRVLTVIKWILLEISEHQVTGRLLTAPPILSRVYQELSSGMLGFSKALKIVMVPFPLPFAQVILYFLFGFYVICPFIVLEVLAGVEEPPGTVPKTILRYLVPLLFNFLCTGGYAALNEIAIEIEDPFGEDANDFPVHVQQWHIVWAIEDVFFSPIPFAPKDWGESSSSSSEEEEKEEEEPRGKEDTCPEPIRETSREMTETSHLSTEANLGAAAASEISAGGPRATDTTGPLLSDERGSLKRSESSPQPEASAPPEVAGLGPETRPPRLESPPEEPTEVPEVTPARFQRPRPSGQSRSVSETRAKLEALTVQMEQLFEQLTWMQQDESIRQRNLQSALREYRRPPAEDGEEVGQSPCHAGYAPRRSPGPWAARAGPDMRSRGGAKNALTPSALSGSSRGGRSTSRSGGLGVAAAWNWANDPPAWEEEKEEEEKEEEDPQRSLRFGFTALPQVPGAEQLAFPARVASPQASSPRGAPGEGHQAGGPSEFGSEDVEGVDLDADALLIGLERDSREAVPAARVPRRPPAEVLHFTPV